jgi:hypothetical protein
MSRGRPFERGNKCSRGRPKGSPNKKTPQAQELFEQNSAAIMALAINSSRKDPQMLRMLVSRIVARPRELPVKSGRLRTNTLQDLDRASELTFQKATSGKLSLSVARDICTMIENRRRVLVAQDLERRLNALENGAGMAIDKGPPKKFDGTLMELLELYRELITEEPPDEEDLHDGCGSNAVAGRT